jgi:hypothetical protein
MSSLLYRKYRKYRKFGRVGISGISGISGSQIQTSLKPHTPRKALCRRERCRGGCIATAATVQSTTQS